MMILEALKNADADQLRREIADLEAEAKALRTLLRSVIARQKARDKSLTIDKPVAVLTGVARPI